MLNNFNSIAALFLRKERRAPFHPIKCGVDSGVHLCELQRVEYFAMGNLHHSKFGLFSELSESKHAGNFPQKNVKMWRHMPVR